MMTHSGRQDGKGGKRSRSRRGEYEKYGRRYYNTHRDRIREQQAEYQHRLRLHREMIINLSDEDFLIAIGFREVKN